ncbi:MAG TPA: aconitate hydratase AcnA [Ktedonobacterales bacterium]|nr:aconitate hydratase AcnA [Ktedonobacterales bacterium]
MPAPSDPFGARTTLPGAATPVAYYPLAVLAQHGVSDLSRMPITVRLLVENLLRHSGESPDALVHAEDVLALARWTPKSAATAEREFAFLPARVILQDFTGVPCVVDLAAMRSAIRQLGGDPAGVNPLVPADLVIDHSVQVDFFGTTRSFAGNVEREYERNGERYALLRWAQQAFKDFQVVPPGTGIVHQVNLEYLAKVVQTRPDAQGELVAFPDTLVGTDSHTTMINGLGVLGWGVGGIEAEAVLLGQPLYLLAPEVIGVRLSGAMPEGTTATDLVLAVTQLLRKRGVVGQFVEFAGAGLSSLSLPDRATISNMCPEYGATASLFPVDDETLRYLRGTGRDEALVDLVERYTKEQGLFRTDSSPEPQFDQLVELDLGTIEPSLAGPRRPQDRVALPDLKQTFLSAFAPQISAHAASGTDAATAPHRTLVAIEGEEVELRDGAVAIAAITSCTNTSNPSVMVGAGLLARNAVARGLRVKPTVKTSLAPGSRAVSDYLLDAGLTPYLDALGFHLVGYGCTTCIGNSGPLPDPVAQAVKDDDLVVAAVLSGNRNFEGRIHPQVRASFLASPPLVVAFALAGRVDIDLTTEPLGEDPNGQPVYLRDIWPTQAEINETLGRVLKPEQFKEDYGHVFDGDEHWRALPVPASREFEWNPDSTYVREPPFVKDLPKEPAPLTDIAGARVLVAVGDSITTDHISPAGSIGPDSPAGIYLKEHGVQPRDFNSYGSRRGNHEVMMRGTFGNIRLRNALVPEKEGYWTKHLPDGAVLTIYDAAQRYIADNTPLLVLAGKEYGSGSSRDWAAKGTLLLGVRATLAESYERIHRSNLVGMGVLPLQYQPGENRESLGLSGEEVFSITGIAQGLTPGKQVQVTATRADGHTITFAAIARLDGPVDIDYYCQGGILPAVLRRLAREHPAHP